MVTEKMIEALKPCPFCGGSDVHLRHHQANQMSWISCVGCGLEAPSETGVTDDEAVAYWNRRAESALSTDAEPVAWVDAQELQYLQMVSGNKAWADFQRSIKVGGKKEGRSPLYAAPPAPSVAVKALEWEGSTYTGWSAYGLGLGYQIDDESSDEECFILGKHEGSSVLKSAHASLAAAQDFAQADYEARIRSALSAQVQDVPDLDTRMRAAGMYTIAEMMGVTPLTKWKSNPAINTIEAFSEWLDRKVSEYLSMKAKYDLGDKSEDDDLFEWVLAHAGVFSTIRDQFQVVNANPASKQEAAGQDDTHLEEIADGAWGDDPATRGRARDELARRRAAAPAAKLEEKP